MELHVCLSRSAFHPGEVLEGVIHVLARTDAADGDAARLDWLAARAHGNWRLAGDAPPLASSQPPLAGGAPGIIACDIIVPNGGALTYQLRVPLSPTVSPSYCSGMPARAGARERSGAGLTRLDYALHVEAQRRSDGRILSASIVIPFEVLPLPHGCNGPALSATPGTAPVRLMASPKALAASPASRAPVVRPLRPASSAIPPAGSLGGRARSPDEGALHRVEVELRGAGAPLGLVTLPAGQFVGSDGSAALTLTLSLYEAAPLLCVAACARLQTVERLAVSTGGWGPPRTVTVAECDAHTEHASLVTLALHQPLGSPPELPAAAPVTCSWQLQLELAVRPRAEPHAPCASLTWVHPLQTMVVHDEAPAFACGRAGVVGFVEF